MTLSGHHQGIKTDTSRFALSQDQIARCNCLYSLTTISVVEYALLPHIGIFGAPLFLVSDNGTQYVNEIIAKLLDNMAVVQIQPTPYSHQENSREENAHKESLRHLRSILFAGADLRQWAIAAPFAQRLVNTQEMESIGCSPNQMVRGNTLDTNTGLFQHFVPCD